MRHDDRVFVAHMVEFARKAHERVAWRESGGRWRRRDSPALSSSFAVRTAPSDQSRAEE
jgi:hypothetical protein